MVRLATTLLSAFVLSVCAASFATAADSSNLAEMDADIAKQYGGNIAEKFSKSAKDLQIKVEPNFEKAVGLFNAETNEGIIAVPAKSWKEDRENKALDTDCGVPMCLLMMSQTYNPLIDGKPIDVKKLRKVKFSDADGNEREATCLLCSVKHVEGDDYQLHVYGNDKEPIIKSQWGEADDAPKGDLALTVQDPKDGKANLVFNIFGKYSSSISIGTKAK